MNLINNNSTLLVSMPWASTVRPSLGIGNLVSGAKNKGYNCSSFYANLLFSSMLDPDVYEYFAETPALFGLCEHFFATDIFKKQDLDSDNYLNKFVKNAKASKNSDNCMNKNPFKKVRDKTVPDFLDLCLKEIQTINPDIIGFSCTFNQFIASLALAKRVKKLKPETTIVFGGAAMHGVMGINLSRKFHETINYVFTGESDFTFIEFLDSYYCNKSILSIPGIAYNGKIAKDPVPVSNLDSIMVPNYDDYFYKRDEILKKGDRLKDFQSLPYESSRGCWWGQKSQCSFCGLNNMGVNYRKKSTDKIINEISKLALEYNCNDFMAADNILDITAHKELLPNISNLPLKLNLFYEIKSNLSRDKVAALAKAGVNWVQPGIESFSNNVLKLMNKGTTDLKNIQLIKWLFEYNISPSYNILTGFPGETVSDYEEMITILKKIDHLPSPSGKSSEVQVHRFSPFFNQPEKYGIKNIEPAKYYKHLIPESVLKPLEYAYYFERTIPLDNLIKKKQKELNDLILNWKNNNKKVCMTLNENQISLKFLNNDKLVKEKNLSILESLILLLSDSQIKITSLLSKITKNKKFDTKDVLLVLDKLIELKLIVKSRNRVLSTVPFDRPMTEHEIQNCISNHLFFKIID